MMLESELNKKKPEISIVLPCRNEELAISYCLNEIKKVIEKNNLDAEIIISDSSDDKSLKIAKKFLGENKNLNIRIIKHNKEGYGNAYIEAFKHVNGNYVFMSDCDGSYDFNEIPIFIDFLKKNFDFVIGNRLEKIEDDTMPFSHRYIGNPLISLLLRLLFKTKIKDTQSGMRAIKTVEIKKLNLQTAGMEFASEMIIKSIKNNLKIKEIPISYKKRIGKSKLNSFSDGLRHIRFMLLYSPLLLFFIPGFFLFSIGLVSLLLFYFKNPSFFGLTFYTHPIFISSLLIIIGYQLIIFSIFAKTYAITHLKEKSKLEIFYKYVTLEKAIFFGFLIILTGIIVYLIIFYKWIISGFGNINEIKNSIIALNLIIIGIQTIFSSFMLSILGIKEK